MAVEPRHRVLRVLTVVSVIVVLAELVVRGLASQLPAPIEWSSDEAQVKFDDLRRQFPSAPGGIVFVGSSLADAGLDPAVISARVPGRPPTYNAALLGSPMETIELWTTKAVVPVARPSTVVVGVSCREMNGAESEQQGLNEEFKASWAMRERLGTDTALDRLGDRAARLSYLVRYRSVLRQPRNLFGRDRRVGHLLNVSQTGRNTAFAERRYPAPGEVTKVLFPGAITRFRLSQEALQSLRRLLRALRAQGVRALVVNMPVTSDFVSWMPGGIDDHMACVEAVRAATEGDGGMYLDAGVWQSNLFADPIHTNGLGAARVSTLVADALSGTG